jgi:hypothetical protein
MDLFYFHRLAVIQWFEIMNLNPAFRGMWERDAVRV